MKEEVYKLYNNCQGENTLLYFYNTILYFYNTITLGNR